MDRVTVHSRRNFVRLAASAAAASSILAPTSRGIAAPADPDGDRGGPWRGLKVGLASYSFKSLSREEAIQGIRRVGVDYVSIKEFHLPLKSTAGERKEAAREFRDAGITPISCGVIALTDDEAQARNAFEYARDAGIPTIVCKPTRESLSMLDKLVDEFDIRLAIHNHGPEDKVWPSPVDVWEGIRDHDERIGLCIDVGHTARCGVDPAGAIRKYAARLYDVHLKDLASVEAKSKPIEVGRGVLDVGAMLQALLEIRFEHHVGLEHEKDFADPIPGVAECFGYVRGALSQMRPVTET